MKALAIFAGVVVVGLGAIALGLQATGGSAPSAATPPVRLTHAQFVRAANGVCRRFARKGNAIFKKKPKTLKQLARGLRIAFPLLQREEASLRAVTPPAADFATDTRLLREFSVAVHDFHAMLHGVKTRQILRVVVFARQADRLGKRLDRTARKLGLTVCAKD
jgi:hypothetical protein